MLSLNVIVIFPPFKIIYSFYGLFPLALSFHYPFRTFYVAYLKIFAIRPSFNFKVLRFCDIYYFCAAICIFPSPFSLIRFLFPFESIYQRVLNDL